MGADVEYGERSYDKQCLTFKKANLAFIVAFSLDVKDHAIKNSADMLRWQSDNPGDDAEEYGKFIEEHVAETLKKNFSASEPYPCYKNKCSNCEKSKDGNCTDRYIFNDIHVIEEFLHHELMDLRFLLDSFTILWPGAPAASALRGGVKGKAILSIDLNTSFAVMMFNLNLHDVTPIDIILLKQIFYKHIEWNVQFNGAQFDRPFDHYVKKVKEAFNSKETRNTDKVSLLEILQLDNGMPCVPARKLVDDNPRQIYGLLTGDEGWKYVPDKTARDATTNHWSTRDFVSVVSAKNSIVMINLNGESHYEEYIADTRKIFEEYGQQGLTPYFESGAAYHGDIACLNHGILFVVENALLEEYNIKHFLNTHKQVPDDIDQLMEVTDDYDRFFEIVHPFYIPEIDRMSGVIRSSFKITNSYEELKYKREFLEKRLTMKYTKQVNNLIAILTILGVLVAGYSISGVAEPGKTIILVFIAIALLTLCYNIFLVFKYPAKKLLREEFSF